MKLSELLVPDGPVPGDYRAKSVGSLSEIEDIKVLETFMLPNNCHNEGCFIKALKDGKEIFLLCTTGCGFYYDDFFIIDADHYQKSKEWHDIRNGKVTS